MTMPDERLRAVNLAREFLYDLLDPKKTPRVPRDIRGRAKSVLRHYPMQGEIEQAAELAPALFQTQSQFYANFPNIQKPEEQTMPSHSYADILDAQTELKIYGYLLEMTSCACPEQYDVLDKDGKQVGYLRLRGGYFRADVPECGGETVYESQTKGDGIFDEDERMPELSAAVRAIDAAITKERNEQPE